MATTAQATSASPAKGHRYPCRSLLRERRLCPGCGLEMSYHALAYKHRCKQLPADPASKRRRRLEQLDARIQRRLGDAAGSDVQSEVAAVTEELVA